jgi:diguanylate cyclase (GGDEF)-like protein
MAGPDSQRRSLALTAILLGVLALLPWVLDLLEQRLAGIGLGRVRGLVDSLVTVLLGLWILHMIRREQRLTRRHMHELEALSLTDPLTGLGNRRAFERDLRLALHRARRTREPVALLYMDVNGLKILNDRYGHRAGDETLRCLGSVLRSESRTGVDSGFRVGGDEFVMMLAADRVGAEALASRLTRAFRERSPHGSSLSAGVVLWNGEARLQQFLDEADRRMYRAKRPDAAREAADRLEVSSP